jgi:peptidoglycan hydrolase CwlO-like protein
MGQVAFDTQEFVETLENAGLPKEQARAISIAVRKSHEVADVATRRDLEDAKKDIGTRFDKVDARFEKVYTQIADVRKDIAAQFEKTDAKIAEVRKDLSTEMNLKFERTDAQVALLRKDIESLTNRLVIKMASIMVGVIGVATAIIKLF